MVFHACYSVSDVVFERDVGFEVQHHHLSQYLSIYLYIHIYLAIHIDLCCIYISIYICVCRFVLFFLADVNQNQLQCIAVGMPVRLSPDPGPAAIMMGR